MKWYYSAIHSVEPTKSPKGTRFFFCLAWYDTYKGIFLGYYDISSHKFQYSFPRSRLFGEFNHLTVLEKASYLTLSHNYVRSRPGNDNSDGNSLKVSPTCLLLQLTFKRRIKSHLPFAGIIRSSPYSPRFQDNG